MTCDGVGARIVSGGASNEYRCHETAGEGRAGDDGTRGVARSVVSVKVFLSFHACGSARVGGASGVPWGAGSSPFRPSGRRARRARRARRPWTRAWRSPAAGAPSSSPSQPRFKQRGGDEVRDPAAPLVRLPRRRSVDATGYPPLALAGSRWTNRGVCDARGGDGVRVSCVRRARRCFDRATRSHKRSLKTCCLLPKFSNRAIFISPCGQ